MPEHTITSLCRALALSLALGLGANPVHSWEAPASLLARAWDEYGMQTFSAADRLFAEVVDATEATQQERWQAMLGQALVTHYQMPGRDPEAAIPQYEALLKEVGQRDEWRGRVLGRLADCHMELAPPQVDRARSLYQEALAALPSQSLQSQETMLRLLSTYLQRPDRSEMRRGLERAAELAPHFAGTSFESVFHGLRAEMAFFSDDYTELADALDRQYRAGINNISVKEAVLFRLARLNEVELHDYARAEDYYRRLAAEVPSSAKAHFAVLRADELKVGKLESDYAPSLMEHPHGR